MTRAFSAAGRPRYRLARYAASLSLLMLWNASADARSLETVIERGALTLCASPNALPFASKTGPVPGFQIELGEKIAEQLGVKLTREWVISAIQYRRADCDLVLDVIARKDTPPAGGVRASRPYHRSGVVLAVRSDSQASSLANLGSDQRVGVPVGSLVSMTLAKGGTATSPFVFEDDIVAALANREIEAAAVTRDDGRLVQPAACRQAVAPDSGVRQRPGLELEYCGRAASPRRQAASSVSMRRSRPCWQMAPSRGSMPATASSCDLRSEARYPIWPAGRMFPLFDYGPTFSVRTTRKL